MRRSFCIIRALVLFATVAPAQQNLYDHLFWDAFGQRPRQYWGYWGLNALGRINDSIEHAIAIGDGDLEVEICRNRFPLDTAALIRFQGWEVIRGNFNGDEYTDYVVTGSDPNGYFNRVVYGTPKPDSIEDGIIYHFHNTTGVGGFSRNNTLVVADLDGDGYDDIACTNQYFEDSTRKLVGALFFFKGGPQMDSTPSQSLIGTNDSSGHVGGWVLVGKFKDTSQLYLAEARHWESLRTMTVFLYRCGPGFRLAPSDTITLTGDSVRYGNIAAHIFGADINGDGIDDFLVATDDKVEEARTGRAAVVAGYLGGSGNHPAPTMLFHIPPGYDQGGFGIQVADVGDVCGKGYGSILISGPTCGNITLDGGAVFLFNTGTGYRDSCVGVAQAFGQPESFFGELTCCVGDVNGDGLADFAVGSQEGTYGHGSTVYNGHVAVFLGDPSYATPNTAVAEERTPPESPSLSVFPNPCASQVWIALSPDLSDVHRARRVRLIDMLGREVCSSVVTRDGFVRLNVASLQSGAYRCVVDGRANPVVLVKAN